MFLFTDAGVQGKPIKVFNNRHMKRDFTYIDDITEGVDLNLKKNTKPGMDKGEK